MRKSIFIVIVLVVTFYIGFTHYSENRLGEDIEVKYASIFIERSIENSKMMTSEIFVDVANKGDRSHRFQVVIIPDNLDFHPSLSYIPEEFRTENIVLDSGDSEYIEFKVDYETPNATDTGALIGAYELRFEVISSK